MKRPFSHSSLSTYDQCPAKYRFIYIDGIEKPQESVEAFLGRRVHESMEFLYREVIRDRIPVYDQVGEDFRQRWEDNWHSDIVLRNNLLSPSDYRARGERCLAWYYRTHYPFRQPVVGTEVVLLFELDQDKKYPIKGIVDRLENHGNGSWEIHDYKTSKRALTQAEANRDRQLTLYHMGLEQTYESVREVDLVWHFLRAGTTVRSRRTAQQRNKFGSAVKRKIDEISIRAENGGPFPAVESPLCNWCYFWEECPAKSGDNPFVKRRISD